MDELIGRKYFVKWTQMDADDRKGMNYLHLSGWVKLESVQFNASGIIFATEFHALG
ncbi:MAG: hypothetical protein ACK40T_06110 [Akkermansiaceae bacterium]